MRFGVLTPFPLPSGTVLVAHPYISRYAPRADYPSKFARRMKHRMEISRVNAMAKRIARDLLTLRVCVDAVVPMPRRDPSGLNGTRQLALALARELGVPPALGLLVRTKLPTGGIVRRRRLRYSPTEHARTMCALRAHFWSGTRCPLVVDNVVTTGATMEGALRAIRRDLGVRATGLAVTGGELFRPTERA